MSGKMTGVRFIIPLNTMKNSINHHWEGCQNNMSDELLDRLRKKKDDIDNERLKTALKTNDLIEKARGRVDTLESAGMRKKILKKISEMRDNGKSEDEIWLEILGFVGSKVLDHAKDVESFVEEHFNMVSPDDE